MRSWNILIVLLFSLTGYSQTYYVSVKNSLPYNGSGERSYCFRSNPASVPSEDGYLRLQDGNGNILENSDGDFILTTRPSKFIEFGGKCRWIEGPNRGRTYSLGGYTFEIPENQNSFYEVKTFATAPASVIFFEKFNNTVPDLNCNGATIIEAPSVVPTAAIIEWEYSLNSVVKKINNSENKRSISVSLDSFQEDLSANTDKTIYFRFKMDNGIQSSFKGYKIVNCSPQLQGPPIPQKTSCNYKNDGSFTLNFDRDLNSGERLAITLFIQNTISGAFDVIPAGGQILDISTLNNKSYTWPNNLPAGNYKLKYQSHTGGLSGNDPSWTGNSLEPVDLTIGNAAPVDFSVFGSADENCFEVKDGYIDLRATREGSRQLFYQYSIDGGAYSSWFPFSSGNETRINGLGKGEYKIKVKDSEGCLAK